VVVPTRNSARTLEACLESIRSQTYSAVELVVVDNHSLDATQAIAERFSDILDRSGPERSAQRNRGAKLASGEYFLFIDSDMRLTPGVITDCLDMALARRARAVIIPEESIGEGFLARCRALERSCYTGDDSIEAARFFTREAFELAGGFDEGLNAMEDWDLTIRVAEGSSLPRTSSRLVHDEGRLKLVSILRKKRYYATSARRYWRKHRLAALQQANMVFRPAFARNWKRLARQPHLTIGFLALKGLESAAVTWGLTEDLVLHREGGR
jgi:glycosyltransferase involved in cell wall biosynthesis